MLFRSKSKSQTNPTPATPRPSRLTLPDDRYRAHQGAFSAPAYPPGIPMPSYVAPQRSMPPLTTRDSFDSQYSARIRTSSLSSTTSQGFRHQLLPMPPEANGEKLGPIKAIKSILKPTKPTASMYPATPATTHNTPLKPQKYMPEPMTPAPAQFRPSLYERGRGYSMQSATSYTSSSSSGYATDSAIPQRRALETSSKRYSGSHSRSFSDEKKHTVNPAEKGLDTTLACISTSASIHEFH
ncbi:hypothetical protein C8J56DRAFT_210204 [Mycena floridula]|nr:hypothetical protein C8J56DRAFT_210204 [Mycena floridula]